MERKKKEEGIKFNLIGKIAELVHLETMTIPGRVNLVSIVALAAFVVVYTASDTINYAISTVSDVIKTCILKEDIHHPAESVSVFKILIPLILLVFFCELLLIVHENHKKKTDEK